MKMNTVRQVLASVIVVAVIGCEGQPQRAPIQSPVVAEGVILYVEYDHKDGRTGGFTRQNDAKSVPGGNGSWNIDAYGRLTDEYLIITRPQRKDLGPRVIPAHRLVDLQFLTGEIVDINESQPAPSSSPGTTVTHND